MLDGVPTSPTLIRIVLPSIEVPPIGGQHAVDESAAAVYMPAAPHYPPPQGKEDAGGPTANRQGTVNVYPQHSLVTVYLKYLYLKSYHKSCGNSKMLFFIFTTCAS